MQAQKESSDSRSVVSSTRDIDDLERHEVMTKSTGRKPAVAPTAAEPISPRTANPYTNGGEALNPSEDVLTRRRGPGLVVETLGPRRIVVGKQAAYRIVLRNLGDVAASSGEVTVDVPSWADVSEVSPSRGTAESTKSSTEGARIRWTVPNLRAGGHEELVIKILPRESRPLALAVELRAAPIKSQFRVEVREPKLKLDIAGPTEVRYGETAVYELTFSNAGTADAENVLVRLMPIDAGDEAETHDIGVIPAGSKQVVEIELVARQPGVIIIQAEATADSGLRSEVRLEVIVRRAEIRVDIKGPKFRYAHTVAAYTIRISNSGNATAHGVQLGAKLPVDSKFLSCTGDGQQDAGANSVGWTVPDIQAGGEQVFVLKCELQKTGANRIQVSALAEGDLRDANFVSTEVEALADLDLDVHDPKGPMPVGEDVTYEVIVRNLGSKSADNVEVFAYFSKGIEPTQVLGHRHQIEQGKVTLEPIKKLGPGEEAIIKIIARAHLAGNHIFRAEVRCESLETTLSEQETTRFYGENRSHRPQRNSEKKAQTGLRDVERSALRGQGKLTPSYPKPVDSEKAPQLLTPEPLDSEIQD